jgi:glycosyltransferase A (GT-A) superfamily protein (DUF2064 family)
MRDVGVIVLAKAPVAGLAKTRVAKDIGFEAAAEIAAACLLDTIDVVESWVGPQNRLIALEGDLGAAARAAEISARIRSWSVVTQRGRDLGSRIVNAHEDSASIWSRDTVTVQIGMDSPSIRAADLRDLTESVCAGRVDAALGLAADGGWWGLATGDPRLVRTLGDVPMSRSDTGGRTLSALIQLGGSVSLGRVLRDVDTFDDAMLVAEATPHSHLAEAIVHLAAVTR